MQRTRIVPAVLAGALLAAVAGCATTGSQPAATTPQAGKGPTQTAANPHMGTNFSLLAFTATGSMGRIVLGSDTKQDSNRTPGSRSRNQLYSLAHPGGRKPRQPCDRSASRTKQRPA